MPWRGCLVEMELQSRENCKEVAWVLGVVWKAA